MSRLGQSQVKSLGQKHELVEEVAWKRDIVVDHDQPVVSLGGVSLEQTVEVFELPRRPAGALRKVT